MTLSLDDVRNKRFRMARKSGYEVLEVDEFVDAVAKLDGDAAFRALRARFGVSRTDPAFWGYSDRINDAYRKQAPIEGGLFDFNRLDGL